MSAPTRYATPAGSLLALLALAGCGSATPEAGPRTVQPGAPGEASRVITDPAAPDAREPGYTEADARFMRGMLIHHAQALVMTALVPERTDREAIRLLAQRIELSQETEMAQMRRWLEVRGEPVPAVTTRLGEAARGADHAHMPGMASPEELARLAAAEGAAFDRLFLELMTRHHQGALVMVEDLLAMEGAGREPELFQFLTHVDADQRAEIARMQRMLDEM